MKQQEALGHQSNALTLRGFYRSLKREARAKPTVGSTPSLKALAREIVETAVAHPGWWPPTLRADAKRWLQEKRGGSDERRQARREKRAEQKSIRAVGAVGKAAPKAGGKDKGKKERGR